MSDEAEMWWECTCGERFGEAGDTAGCGRAGAHTRDMKVQDPEGGHRIIGLLNDAGEILLNGWNLKGARTLFGITGTKAQRQAEAAGQAPAAQGKGAKGAGGAAGLKTGAAMANPPTRRFHILAGDIFLSDAIPTMFQESARQRPDLYEDGALSDVSTYNAEMADFVNFCVIRFCIEHADELGLNRMMSDISRYGGHAPRGEEEAV